MSNSVNESKSLLRFRPAFKDYIWGGTKLNEKYNKNSGFEKTAESWELSVHPDGPSVISNGENKGMILSEYISKNPSVLGTSRKTDELPILIKLIDAEDKLSIQVHPNDEQAHAWEGQNGKTEMWYVLDADEDAKIVYGVKENISKKDFKEAIVSNTVEELLDSTSSKKGDVFFVDSGTIHAIGKGNVIAEIQQNSNVTYRLYDYDRRDKEGNPRELHIEKGVAASKTNKILKREIPHCSDGSRLLGSCEYFSVKEFTVDQALSLNCSTRSYQSLIGVDGVVELANSDNNETISVGNTVFLPAGFGEYTLKGNGKVLVVENHPRYYVGIDLGGTNIVAAVIDENGVIYGRSECKTNMPRSYKEIFDDMAECAKESAVKSGIPWDIIESVGIGCPGAINKENGNVDFSNNLDFYNVPITEYMENKLSKKVYVENDANCAAWGEFVAGSGKNTQSMILITLGTGVGSGIINDGHLFRGAFGTGAELGHMVIISNGEKCTCGRKGCLEAYASATALVNQTKIAMKENPKSKMWDVVSGNIYNVNGKTVFDTNDEVSKNVIDTYLGYLAEGVVNIANMFQPEVISIGGGISGSGDIIIKPLNDAIRKKAFARFGNKHTQVNIATLGNDAGIIGAALLWMDEV